MENSTRIAVTGMLLAGVIAYVTMGLITLVGPTQVQLRGKAEGWAISGCILAAGLAAALASQQNAGHWRPMIQFALGDWPETDQLSQQVLFWGIAVNTLTSLGFPILLATIVYRSLTRRSSMQISQYIAKRDEYLKVQIYLAVKEQLERQVENRDAWQAAEQVITAIQDTWDINLPPQTQQSLERDEVIVVGDSGRHARVRQ
jgi:hypothetical protein